MLSNKAKRIFMLISISPILAVCIISLLMVVI